MIFNPILSSFRSLNILWNPYIHHFIFTFPGYISNQFNYQLPAVGLLALLVKELHRYNRGQDSILQAWIFFLRISFRNCVSFIFIWLLSSSLLLLLLSLLLLLLPSWSLSKDQLPVGLLAQLVRALHQYHRGQGSNPGMP